MYHLTFCQVLSNLVNIRQSYSWYKTVFFLWPTVYRCGVKWEACEHVFILLSKLELIVSATSNCSPL